MGKVGMLLTELEMRDDVVEIARRWIGTPYENQASCEGAGADCLGLIRGVWRETVGPEPEGIPAYTPDWSEPAKDEYLLAAVTRILMPVSTMQAGDVLIFRLKFGSVAKHLAIISTTDPDPKIIHAYTGYGVVETSLSPKWTRRIAGIFRFPDRRPEWQH